MHPKLLLDLGDESPADRHKLRHLLDSRVLTGLVPKTLDGLGNGELLFERVWLALLIPTPQQVRTKAN